MTVGLAPRWASAPGTTIQAILDERKLGIDYLATALDIPLGEARALLEGQAAISAERAEKLSRSLGASARFWLTREAEYAEDRIRVMAADWSSNLPLSNMARLGWIRAGRDWRETIDECLAFFGVDDFEEWLQSYPGQTRAARYRKSTTLTNDDNATLVWFRAGDRETEGGEPSSQFDADALRKSIPRFRELTRLGDPQRFIPELTRVAGSAGVKVVVVPAPDGCRASGVTRWVHATPLIQLSARYLSDDHFWFAFFHEVGHVLHHADRRETFIDVDFDTVAHDEFEAEADHFAEAAILGDTDVAALAHEDHRAVIRAAALLGVSPGLLVGQLQHRGILGREQLNRLKRRYRWDGTNLVAK